MQRTIRVRRANNLTTAVGKHMSLSKVAHSDTQQFAFAILDNGEEVYIPAIMVRNEQMTSADEGAGFTCPVRPNPRVIDEPGKPAWLASTPIKWDDQNPETITIEDDEPEPNPNMEIEHEALVNAGAELIDQIGPLNLTIERLDKMLQGMGIVFANMKAQRIALKQFADVLDDVAPEQ